MQVIIDIETLPGDLASIDDGIQEIVKGGQIKCPLKKNELIEALGDPKLKYKTVDELVPMWLANPENARSAAMETYRNQALDGGKGRLLSWAAATMGGDVVGMISPNDEQSCLEGFASFVRELCVRKDGQAMPFFIANNATFDLSFLFKRFVINGISPGFRLPFNGWHDKDYYCTMQGWAGKGALVSQDNLCKALGIEGKPDDIDGSKVFDYAMEGKFEEIFDYNKDDVKKCREIYRRLTFAA